MRKKTYIWLASIVLFGILLRLIFFIGVGLSDDLAYTRYSERIVSGQYEMPKDHHGTRIGIVYPVAFLYGMFGINDYSSVAIPFIFSVLSIILTFYFGELLFNEKIGLMSAFLLSFFPLDVHFASKLLTDVPSMFFLSLGVYFFLKAEKMLDRSVNFFYILCGLSLGIAYLLRENAVLVFLFFGAYSLFYKKFKLNYFNIALGFLIVVLIEMYVFYITTGNPLYRFTTVSKHFEEIFPLDDNYGRGSTIGFVFGWPSMIFNHLVLRTFYPFIFIAMMYCIFYKRQKTLPLIIWFIAILGYLSYGTLSLSSYLPFPSIPRYTMIVSFPALLMLSVFLMSDHKIIKKLRLTIIAIMLIASLGVVYFEKKANDNLVNEIKLAHDYIKEIDGSIYTDTRTKSFLEYLSGYRINNIHEFNNCVGLKCAGKGSFILEANQIHNAYILINKDVMNSLRDLHTYTNFPEWADNPPKEWKIVKKISKSMILYYAE